MSAARDSFYYAGGAVGAALGVADKPLGWSLMYGVLVWLVCWLVFTAVDKIAEGLGL